MPPVEQDSIPIALGPPTSTPTRTPTATPTPTPTVTPTPARTWSASELRQPAHSGPTDRPIVGLTIDDGWSDRDTVLAVLKQKEVGLTLFLAGRAIGSDTGFIARAVAAGQEIANHTMDHYTLTDKSHAYIQKDLQDFEELVNAASPSSTTKPFMRPSGGSINATVIEASAQAGYRPILWSLSCGDGSTATTVDQMVSRVVGGAAPGTIVLSHFGPRNVVALPRIIDGLRAKGLEPVTLSRLFGLA